MGLGCKEIQKLDDDPNDFVTIDLNSNNKPEPQCSAADHDHAVGGGGFLIEKAAAKKTKAGTTTPLKQVVLALTLLFLGLVFIAFGIYMFVVKMGGSYAKGAVVAVFGLVLIIPGFYYTSMSWFAYKGYQGFSSKIPRI